MTKDSNIEGPQAKLERIKECYIEGAKRQYMPYNIVWTCPNCDIDFVDDLTDQYLSYPQFGISEFHHLCCRECTYECEIEVLPEISLKLVKKEEI